MEVGWLARIDFSFVFSYDQNPNRSKEKKEKKDEIWAAK